MTKQIIRRLRERLKVRSGVSEQLYWLLWTSVQKRSFEKRETKEKRGVHVCEVLETEPAWEHVSDTRSREKVV